MRARTLWSTSAVQPPYAPAFMKQAPPTEPGMPQANSSPESPSSQAISDASLSVTPAWHVISSPSTLTLVRPSARATITPR